MSASKRAMFDQLEHQCPECGQELDRPAYLLPGQVCGSCWGRDTWATSNDDRCPVCGVQWWEQHDYATHDEDEYESAS